MKYEPKIMHVASFSCHFCSDPDTSCIIWDEELGAKDRATARKRKTLISFYDFAILDELQRIRKQFLSLRTGQKLRLAF